MAIRPLFPLTKQFQARNGQNNVSGTLEVFYAYTDDRAPTYSDYNGTRNPDLVPIDNNGRAVVLCDDERVYRLVVRDRSGGILWTQEPTVCEGEGSGGSTSIVSDDGSIVVQRTGSVYDLSVNHTDDSRFLDWIRCTGGESVSGYLRPVKAAGTMSVGSLGLSLSPDVLYHVTATVRAVKGSVAPVYGEVSVTLALHDGETATAVRTFSEIADCSMGLSQDYIVDADVHTPGNATQLVFSVTGDDASLSFLLLSVDAHRVYSGVPRIPDEVAQKTWVDANFQKKLVAGANITIDPVTNTISADALTQVQADWAQSNPADMSYIRNKPTLATVATSGSYDDLSDKPAIPAAQVQSDWSQSNSQSVDFIKNKPNLAAVATSGDYDDLSNKPSIPAAQVQSDWSQSNSSAVDYIKNKPTIPAAQVQSDWNQSDNQAVDYIKNKPSNIVTDANYVHTDNNFTDNDKDKLDDIEAGAEKNVQADWNQTNASADDYIKNKPTIPQQVQSNWAETDISDPSYIQNKPNLDLLATKTELSSGLAGKQDTLTAGDNISIVGNVISATAAPQQQADWSQTDSSAVDYIKNKPSNLVQDADYVHTDNNFSNNDKDKLDGIASGAQVNVQSDWNQTDNQADDFIKNKPTIPVVPAMKSLVAGSNITITEDANGVTISADGGPVDQVYDGTSTNAQSGTAVADAIAASLETFFAVYGVTTIGEVDTAYAHGKDIICRYNDGHGHVYSSQLSSRASGIYTFTTTDGFSDYEFTLSPDGGTGVWSIGSRVIPAAQVNSDWNSTSGVSEILNKPTLATVATTGAYSDLSGTPTINNVPAVTSGDDGKVLMASYSGGVGSYSWATGGGGGGTVDQTYDPTSTNAQSGTAVAGALAGLSIPVIGTVTL